MSLLNKHRRQKLGCPVLEERTFVPVAAWIRQGHLKYGRICAYFLSPIPFTFFRSSALWNGRAAIIRAAITGPTPGIAFNSSSVAVLMSILPSAKRERLAHNGPALLS